MQKYNQLANYSDYLLVHLNVMNFESVNYSLLLGPSSEQKLFVTYVMALLDFILSHLE